MRVQPPTGEDVAEPVTDVGVVVEAEHRIGLRQLPGQLGAVPLGHAPDGNHLATGVVRLQQRVDAVALGRLDESAGVDHDRVGVVGVLDQHPAIALEPRGELFRVDVVARAAESDERDRPGHPSRLRARA